MTIERRNTTTPFATSGVPVITTTDEPTPDSGDIVGVLLSQMRRHLVFQRRRPGSDPARPSLGMVGPPPAHSPRHATRAETTWLRTEPDVPGRTTGAQGALSGMNHQVRASASFATRGPRVQIPPAPPNALVRACESSVGLSLFGFGWCVSLFDPASVFGRQWLRLLCLTLSISLSCTRSRRLSWCWRWFL